jgi:hypothetical protein
MGHFMFVVRITREEAEPDYKCFVRKPDAERRFNAARRLVWDKEVEGTAFFQVDTTDHPREALRLVQEGRATLLDIEPRPMSKAEIEDYKLYGLKRFNPKSTKHPRFFSKFLRKYGSASGNAL